MVFREADVDSSIHENIYSFPVQSAYFLNLGRYLGRRLVSLFEEIECIFEGGHGAGFPRGIAFKAFPPTRLH